ncbi:MAG: HAD hydrolase family protein, partial [Clostridia bacterium]|nr:HAD hydrolase family protein [Clostridia bacterium]
ARDELAGSLGYAAENIMSFGDSTNDTEMVRHAGIGVAMGNAVEELLDTADYITLTNDDDGVAFALENLLNI